MLRETYEEMRLHVRVVEQLPHVDREFRGKHYRIVPFICERIGGKMEVVEHKQAVWQPLENLFVLEWGPAEEKVLRQWADSLPVELREPILASA